MSTLNPAQSALAACLKLSEETFAMALQEAHAGSYHRYRIPKGDGRFREICAPSDAIKAAQRSLLDELLSQVALSPYAHGFAPGCAPLRAGGPKPRVYKSRTVLSHPG